MHMILCLHDFCCLLCVVTVPDEIATGFLMDLDFFYPKYFEELLNFSRELFSKERSCPFMAKIF